MAVKVCVNGQMKQVDTVLHKPVIFLSGQKKVLSKAWTFINGEKIQLWGQEGVNIDYIRANGIVSGYSDIISIGDNWMVTSGANTYYDDVVRWDISNLSSPSMVQKVKWGKIATNGYNGFKSESDTILYFNANRGAGQTTAGNELTIDPSTGVVEINNSFSTTGNDSAGFVGMIGNDFVSVKIISKHTSLGYITYGSKYYFNSTLKHTTGAETDWFYYGGGSVVQTTSSIGLAKTNKGIYALSANSMTQKSTTVGDILMLDGSNVIAKRTNGYGVYDKTTLAEVDYYDADAGKTVLFVGKNGDYYYHIEYDNSGAKLVVLNDSDLTVRWAGDLPLDPFNEGVNFWATAVARPQKSKSGYLGVSGQQSSNTRIIRFSQMFD